MELVLLYDCAILECERTSQDKLAVSSDELAVSRDVSYQTIVSENEQPESLKRVSGNGS